MEKWILDTDIGWDSDDCMALGLILSHKDIELMGVTTVAGKPFARAKLAQTICSRTGRNIPVHCGNEYSLSGNLLQPDLIDGAMEVSESNSGSGLSEENTAVEFIKQTVEENPNEITLVAIGQLTNIALLFSVYPHIPKLLKSLVIMCGRYFERDYCDVTKWGTTEWNVKCDTYAASIVFQAQVKECYVIGVDESCKFNKKAIEVKSKIKNVPYMQPVVEVLKYHDADFPVWFHDAVIVWGYLNREKLKWEKGTIKVEMLDRSEARTKLYEDKNGIHNVLVELETKEFFDYYAKQMGFEWED